jgi:hypothetical protein
MILYFFLIKAGIFTDFRHFYIRHSASIIGLLLLVYAFFIHVVIFKTNITPGLVIFLSSFP